MDMVGYSMKLEGEKYARALGRDLPISRKHAIMVCRAIRGMKLDDAMKYLEDVIAKRRPVPFVRFTTSVGHKRGMGPGRYPVKAAKYILKVLENAEANAEYKGLDTDSMVIRHIAAHKGRTVKKYMPRAYGRATPWFKEHVHIEVILEEVEEE